MRALAHRRLRADIGAWIRRIPTSRILKVDDAHRFGRRQDAFAVHGFAFQGSCRRRNGKQDACEK